MRKHGVPADALFKKWQQEPEYAREYEALSDEFNLARALIAARTHARLTQEELARRMGTTQSAIARLEGGKSRPSTATLEKLGTSTGTGYASPSRWKRGRECNLDPRFPMKLLGVF